MPAPAQTGGDQAEESGTVKLTESIVIEEVEKIISGYRWSTPIR